MTRISAFAAVIAAGLVAGLVVGGLALGWLLAPALSDAEIKRAVARDTGRTLTFAGRRLSLWPELAIELRDVELSNPAGMFEGRFAAADTVRLKIAGKSLWRRKPEVTEIVAVRARINLVVDSEGRSNFAFAPDGGDDARSLPPIVIVDGGAAYLNERSATAFTVANVDATLAAGLDGPLEIDGAFTWNDQRSTVALYARSPARLTADGSPADFTIAGPHVNAAFSGRARLADGLELAGTIDFTSQSLADLLSWAGLAGNRAGGLPLSASGALDLSGGAVRITAGRLAFGPMNAQGDLAVSFAGPRPHVKANLGVDRIDLGLFTGVLAGGEAQPGSAGWSDAPVDFEVLKLLDAELSLAATEIAYGGLAAGPSRLDIGLADGSLVATLVNSGLYGGSASGRLSLDGSGALAAIDGSLKAAGIDGGRLIAAAFGKDLIRGKADIEFDLAAEGASLQELHARLEGQAHLRFAGGALIDIDIPALLGRLATGIAEGWTAAGGRETPFSELAASFIVEDGIAETGGLSLTGPVAEVAGTGSIDLLARRLDFKLRSEIVAQAGGKESPARLPVPIVIEGAWSAPRIYPDVQGILDDPAKAYAALRKLIEAKATRLDFAPGKLEKDPSEAAAAP